MASLTSIELRYRLLNRTPVSVDTVSLASVNRLSNHRVRSAVDTVAVADK